MRKLKKLIGTLRMCACMFCARMFGQYRHSVYDDFPYARYAWHGHDWAIPTGPYEDEEVSHGM